MNPNNWNQLEPPIQSWKPRRPSPGLERKIFGSRSGAAPALHWSPGDWLAPAASLCVVVAQLAFNRPVAGISASVLSPAMFTALSLSHQDLSSYTPGWIHSEHNGPVRETFEWTNRTSAPSTVRTLPVMLSMTNSLFD